MHGPRPGRHSHDLGKLPFKSPTGKCMTWSTLIGEKDRWYIRVPIYPSWSSTAYTIAAPQRPLSKCKRISQNSGQNNLIQMLCSSRNLWISHKPPGTILPWSAPSCRSEGDGITLQWLSSPTVEQSQKTLAISGSEHQKLHGVLMQMSLEDVFILAMRYLS